MEAPLAPLAPASLNAMNDTMMTQLEAMRIIRAQRRKDMARLNGLVMQLLVRGAPADFAARATYACALTVH